MTKTSVVFPWKFTMEKTQNILVNEADMHNTGKASKHDLFISINKDRMTIWDTTIVPIRRSSLCLFGTWTRYHLGSCFLIYWPQKQLRTWRHKPLMTRQWTLRSSLISTSSSSTNIITFTYAHELTIPSIIISFSSTSNSKQARLLLSCHSLSHIHMQSQEPQLSNQP